MVCCFHQFDHWHNYRPQTRWSEEKGIIHQEWQCWNNFLCGNAAWLRVVSPSGGLGQVGKNSGEKCGIVLKHVCAFFSRSLYQPVLVARQQSLQDRNNSVQPLSDQKPCMISVVHWSTDLNFSAFYSVLCTVLISQYQIKSSLPALCVGVSDSKHSI